MNLYEELNELELEIGNTDKQIKLQHIISNVPDGETFIRFVFNDIKYGVKEQTFRNIFGEHNYEHISEYLETQDNEVFSSKTIAEVLDFGNVLETSSGGEQMDRIRDFFYTMPGIQKKWVSRAILKDLRCGIKIKTVNKVLNILKKPIIEQFALQLCDKVDIYNDTDVAKKLYFPLSMECKYDGIRIQAEISSPADKLTFVQLTSRRGKDRTDDFHDICEELADKFAGENVILDGEIISSSFQELTRKDSVNPRKYVIFDLLVDEQLTYSARWDNLRNLLLEKGIAENNNNKNIKYINKVLVAAEHYSASNIEDVRSYYEELNSRKEEGIIIKLDDRPYERNSRKHMFKCKKVYTTDLEVIGFNWGEGKRSFMVGSLCLKDKSGKILVDVGSGIDDVTCEELTNMIHNDKNSLKGLIVEILYNEITETGSIRFPRFIRIRDDKTEPDDLSNEELRQ